MSELVKKTVRVLREVGVSTDGIGLSELSRNTGIPKATCLRVLHALQSEGVVRMRPRDKRYLLSWGLLAFASESLGAVGGRAFRAELEDLVARVGETTGFDVLAGDSVMVAMQVTGPQLMTHAHAAVPRLLPLWRTSTGKVLLAYSDQELVAQLYADATARGDEVPDLKDFEAQLAQVRECGYAAVFEELGPFLWAVAAPVRVGAGVIGAVWTGGPTFRLPDDGIGRIATEVVRAADRLSFLGQSEPDSPTDIEPAVLTSGGRP